MAHLEHWGFPTNWGLVSVKLSLHTFCRTDITSNQNAFIVHMRIFNVFTKISRLKGWILVDLMPDIAFSTVAALKYAFENNPDNLSILIRLAGCFLAHTVHASLYAHFSALKICIRVAAYETYEVLTIKGKDLSLSSINDKINILGMWLVTI